MTRTLLLLIFALSSAIAADWPAELAREGECGVCVRRGGEHGVERLVDWREHDAKFYGFCSKGCAEAFDQMPSGYVEPILPRPAPEFRWSTLSGTEVTPTGQSALLVDFWATWCTPCIAAMPDLERLAAEMADDGLQVVGVSIDEERGVLDAFLERRPVGYAVIHDGGDDPAWWQFRVPAIPAAFLLNGDGEIVAQWSGKVDADAIRTKARALLGSD